MTRRRVSRRCLAAALLAAACASPTQRAVDDTRAQVGAGVERLSDTDPQVEGDVARLREGMAANRRTIVEQNLELSEREALAFWPLYADYQAEIRELNDRLVKLIESFALEKTDPEGARAVPMIEEAIAIREDRLALRRRSVKTLEAVLAAPTLLRYFQIESKIDALVDYELARHVPLAP